DPRDAAPGARRSQSRGKRRRASATAARGRTEESSLGSKSERDAVADICKAGRRDGGKAGREGGKAGRKGGRPEGKVGRREERVEGGTCIIEVWPPAQGDRREGRYPPEVLRGRSPLRLRGDLEDAFDQARAAPRNLLELPPVLHGQAEAPRYRGPRRTLHEEIRRADDAEPQDCREGRQA